MKGYPDEINMDRTILYLPVLYDCVLSASNKLFIQFKLS